jgi:hypothetical protein
MNNQTAWATQPLSDIKLSPAFKKDSEAEPDRSESSSTSTLKRARPTKTEPASFFLPDIGKARKPDAVHETRQIPESLKTVNGTVLATDEDSVTCEVVSNGRRLEIKLLRDLFPKAPVFGMPFALRMENSDGILRPVIETRDTMKVKGPIDTRIEQLMVDF